MVDGTTIGFNKNGGICGKYQAGNNIQISGNVISATGKVNMMTYDVTLTSANWVSIPYAPHTQTVAVCDVSAKDIPIVDIKLSEDYLTAKNELASWKNVEKVMVSEGFITAYCYETRPTTDMNIQLHIITNRSL
jgi:hypothetical protein